MTQRCTQVVRHRIGKRLEFSVGRYQLPGAQRELLVELTNFGVALLTLFELSLGGVACVAEISLDATSNKVKEGNDDRREHKYQKVRDLSRGNLEAVERFREKVGEHRRSQQNGHHSRPGPRVPGHKTDDEDEKRQFYIAELILLERERDGRRDHHRNDRKSVTQDQRPGSLEFAIPMRHVRLPRQTVEGRDRRSHQEGHRYGTSALCAT